MIVDGSGNERAAADPEGNCRLRNEPPASKPREIELDTGRSRRINRSRTARRRKMDIGGIGSLSRDKMPGDSKRARSEKAPFGGGSRFGTTSHLGRRGAMEDALAAELGFLSRGGRSYDFYGVYDGHGGRRVANACSETMHKLMAKFLEDEIRVDQINWGETMTASFRGMDEEVNKIGDEVATVGSTAVVAVVGEEEVVVANCGDSRAVLCRGGVAVQISDDHKPDRPDELERIELCGGKVINWNGARVLGVLATSRSIGDQYLKPYVIPEPEVKIIDRTKSDEFLILASDGLWDVVSNDLACKVTRRCLDGRMGIRSSIFENESNRASEDRCAEAARVLVELAMVRGGSDNVSVIVVNMSQ